MVIKNKGNAKRYLDDEMGQDNLLGGILHLDEGIQLEGIHPDEGNRPEDTHPVGNRLEGTHPVEGIQLEDNLVGDKDILEADMGPNHSVQHRMQLN